MAGDMSHLTDWITGTSTWDPILQKYVGDYADSLVTAVFLQHSLKVISHKLSEMTADICIKK